METLDELFHAIEWEFRLVIGKNLKIFKVVDVAPNHIQGKSSLLIRGYHVLEVRYIFIPPSALMESQTPEWR